MLLLEEKEKQLDLFQDNLPNKPYCSDEKSFLQIRPKALATLKKYIQHNQPTKIKWLVYDCDYYGALEHIQQNMLPAPNIIAQNPINGHAHLFYGLNSPVCISDNGRFKPKDFVRKISYVLGEALQADQGYMNFVSKNPLSESWIVFELEKQSYDLNDFLEWIDIPKVLPKVYKVVGVGRNVTTFEHGRRWAYRQVLGYRLAGNKEAFAKAVLGHCEGINQSFPTPMAISEVKAIAKSIANWTWKYYTARWSDEQFSLIQAKRGAKGGKKSGEVRLSANQEKRLMARSMRSEGATLAKVSEVLGVPLSTVGRWCKV